MSTTPKRTTRVGAAVRGVLGTTIAVPLLFSAMPAAAQSQQQQMQELRQQIQELQGRFNDLQAQQQRTERRAKQAEQAAAETSAIPSGSRDRRGPYPPSSSEPSHKELSRRRKQLLAQEARARTGG